MSGEQRFVFDTNVIVSAVLFEHSLPGQAFYGALQRGKVLLSQAVILELNEVLSRVKFDRYVAREDRERFLVMLVREATIVEINAEVRDCRDPKDDKFLELAVGGQATCLVTGDEDLLCMHPYRGIPILTPAAFAGLLAEESGASDPLP